METKFRCVKEKTVFDIFRKIVRSRTTVRLNSISLLYNLLAILLKKKLFEDKRVMISGFGKFYLFDCKQGPIIRFKMSKRLKKNIHGIEELNFEKRYISYRTLNNIFINFAKCTGLKVKQASFLFYVWMYSLLQALIQEKGCKVKGLGFLYVTRVNFQKKRGINRFVKYFYRVRFKQYKHVQNELNKKKEIFFYKRIKTLLQLNSI